MLYHFSNSCQHQTIIDIFDINMLYRNKVVEATTNPKTNLWTCIFIEVDNLTANQHVSSCYTLHICDQLCNIVFEKSLSHVYNSAILDLMYFDSSMTIIYIKKRFKKKN